MYSYYIEERICFSGMDEALFILTVAFKVMFHDNVKSSMQYLNVIHWRPNKKVKLRAMLSSLQINILSNLVVRLVMGEGKFNYENIEMVKDSIYDLFYMTSNRLEYHNIIDKHMLDYFESTM